MQEIKSGDEKMKPHSPTCAIDADELIMGGKKDLDRARQAEGQKGAKKRVDSDKVVRYSPGTALAPPAPGQESNLLFTKVAKSSLQAPPPPPSPPHGRSSEESETAKRMGDNLVLAKVAPAAPEPAPAGLAPAPSLTPVAPASASLSASSSAVASALGPPPATASPPAPSPPPPLPLLSSCTTALNDSNFLLLAEFAHVVRDTLALRGVQVQQFFFPFNLYSIKFQPDPKYVLQGAAWADKSIGLDGSFDKANVKVWK